ncbi:16S rRNA (guanine(527)-N(7))-methyltransferase RsmG [Dehalobacterium formicoaceticum]|uniref:16S rRNA (guanine(527)-N(7))-methyltransferase RsmG n=1 Tax=Dehalobacterium formicoaceticum TaxID=51515 RepID=UPI001FA8E7EF|nr:16S rRNA (guanine(527)-N(7))-methyltransferase RsmG [Dehalobacterium formicoaceticum]
MNEFYDFLSRGLESMEIDFTSAQLDQCHKYYQILLDWNRKMNLTAIVEEKEVALKHFLDSLMVFKFIPMKGQDHLIDIGTGAGFPGLPLKIFSPKMEVVLLDSLAKRCSFLTEVVRELGLKKVQVIHGRAEDYGRQEKYREKFTLVTARAVTSLPVLLEYCLPFSKIGGIFFALKGPDINEEIEKSMVGIDLLGGMIKDIKHYQLPISGDDRSLIVIEKIKETSNKYPRKAGTPEKHPLSR